MEKSVEERGMDSQVLFGLFCFVNGSDRHVQSCSGCPILDFLVHHGCPALGVLPWSCCFISQGLDVLFWQACPGGLVPSVLSGCPLRVSLSWLSSGWPFSGCHALGFFCCCPVLDYFSWMSCPSNPVLAVLFLMFCSKCTVLGVLLMPLVHAALFISGSGCLSLLFCLPVLFCLSLLQLSCPGCLAQLSCPGSPAKIFLILLSCPNYPFLLSCQTILSSLSCPSCLFRCPRCKQLLRAKTLRCKQYIESLTPTAIRRVAVPSVFNDRINTKFKFIL